MTLTLLDEIAYAQNTRAQARKERLAAGLSLGALGMGAGLVAGLSVFEVGVAFTLMNEIYGPELPMEETPFHIILMSAATLAGVVGFEVLKVFKPESKALRGLELVGYIAVPIFFGGMLVTFGMSEIAGDAAPSSDLLFDDAMLFDEPGPVPSGWDEFLGTISSLSLGSLMIINLIAISKLVQLLRTKLPIALKAWSASNAVLKRAKAFLTKAKELTATRSAIARLDETITTDLSATSAGAIERAAAPTLRTLNIIKLRQNNRQEPPSKRLESRDDKLPHPLPEPRLLDAFTKALDAKIKQLPDQFDDLLD